MLVNFHCHSTLSSDAHSSMPDMARAAQAAGLAVLCITDHCDPLSGRGEPEDTYRWEASEAAWAEAKKAAPALDLRLGIELGGALENPAQAERKLQHPHIDFVLGSIHNLPGGVDYGHVVYTDRAQCYAALDGYLDQLLALARSPYYDALGHLDYPTRYMRQAGFDIVLDPAHPTLQAIFRAVIDSDRAIECNTSGYRNGGSFTLPGREVLAAYRTAGGTRLTIGSDAHHTSQIDLGLRESYQMLREIGFTELTIYRDRVPEQIKLEA